MLTPTPGHPAADGRESWLALVARYDGYDELNKRVSMRAKHELTKLHYKEKRVFPYEKYVTKLKEQFQVLEKGRFQNKAARR